MEPVNNYNYLNNLVSFPMRYIGAKDYSIPGVILNLPFSVVSYFSKDQHPENALFGAGYHRSFEKTLTPKESLQFVKYAAVSGSQDGCDQSWITPLGLQFYKLQEADFDLKNINSSITLDNDCFYDFSTGLKVTISVNAHEIIVGFGAIQSLNHLQWRNPSLNDDERKVNSEAVTSIQLHAVRKNILGLIPPIYEQADELLQVIRSHPEFKGKKLVLSGQCFGGSIAEYLAIKNQIPAVCLNTLPLGAGLQELLGGKLLLVDDYVTHVSVATDFVSDPRILPIFDRVLSLVGIRTPGNFGKRYVLPAGYERSDQIHSYIIGSLMKHLGYKDRDKFDLLDIYELDIAKNANPANLTFTL